MSATFPLEDGSGLQDFTLHDTKKPTKVGDLDAMTEAQLLQLRAQIDARIPGLSLAEVNMTKELLLQLRSAKLLQNSVNEEKSGVPANQKAQVQNSIGNIIDKLAKIQMELYDSEAMKRLKAATIRVIRTLPKPQQDQFFDLMDLETEKIEAELTL